MPFMESFERILRKKSIKPLVTVSVVIELKSKGQFQLPEDINKCLSVHKQTWLACILNRQSVLVNGLYAL